MTMQKCVDCTDTGGCGDDVKEPFCDANACRGCQTDAECKMSPDAAGPLCGTSGACSADGPCTGTGDCSDGVHGQCVDINGGSGAPDLRCRICDPATSDGCQGAQTCGADFTCSP
jgi:hypothetical protein